VILYRNIVLAGAAIVAALLIALHAPGQMSVDSGMALYEGAVGHAAGWGPTFFAAVLKWLGGGEMGATMFVGLNCLAIYACFAQLLSDPAASGPAPAWRRGIAILVALNPVFMFYAGILWKDVMLATFALLAVTLLLMATRRSGPSRVVCLGFALLAIAPLPLLRQQGLLIAGPLALAAAWFGSRGNGGTGKVRPGAMAGILVAVGVACAGLSSLAAATIEPAEASPMSVGVQTIRAYDILGMITYSLHGDQSSWSRASAQQREHIKAHYSAERIDSLWADKEVRNYINSLHGDTLATVWKQGIEHDPAAYATHRLRALSALLGFGPMHGCVPAYWGVAGLPEHLARVNLSEEMDGRDRFIGRMVATLEPSMVFRHWWYAGLLLVASVFLLRKSAGDTTLVLRATAVAAWLYLGSFVPTTIACDFRYLYPVTCLASALAIYLLSHAREAPPRSHV